MLDKDTLIAMVLNTGTLLPSLEGATDWIQEPVAQNSLIGHLTIVHFWAVSCPLCKSNLPKLQQLIEANAPHGLKAVSIHMPRFEADTDVEKVIAAVKELDLTGPCAVDNQHTLGDRFGVVAWPSYFLFDRECKLRSRAAGQLGIKMAANSLARLISLEGAA